jgi:hypothetical protein
MVLQLRKEVANAVQAQRDAEGKLFLVVAETDKKLHDMQSEIVSDRLFDTKRKLAEKDLMAQEIKVSNVIAQLRLEESHKLKD